MVHQHGPRNHRCPVSGKPPAISVPPAQRPSSATAHPPSTQATAQSQPVFPQTQHSQQLTIEHPDLPGNIITHIPRSAQSHCAVQLTTAIKKVTAQPDDPAAWSCLLNYGKQMLLAPPRSGRKHNITNVLKKRTMESTSTSAAHQLQRPHTTTCPDDGVALANAVRSKLEDGNIRAAVRNICSDEKPASINDATLHALHQRHPPAAANRTAVPDPVHVTKQDVCAAIR